MSEVEPVIKGGWTNIMTHISVYFNNFFSAFACVVSIHGKIDELSHFHNIMIKNR